MFHQIRVGLLTSIFTSAISTSLIPVTILVWGREVVMLGGAVVGILGFLWAFSSLLSVGILMHHIIIPRIRGRTVEEETYVGPPSIWYLVLFVNSVSLLLYGIDASIITLSDVSPLREDDQLMHHRQKPELS